MEFNRSSRLPQLLLTDVVIDLSSIKQDFHRLCVELLKHDSLLYNPYPWLVKKLDQIRQRMELEDRSQEIVKKLTTDRTVSTAMSQVVRPSMSCDFVWGGKGVVRGVDPAALWRCIWLLRDVTPNTSTLHLPHGYSCQGIPAFTGPAVFMGSFFNSINNFHFRLQYVVTGSDITEGINIFIDAVLEDLEKTERSKLHVLLSIYVPYRNDEDSWLKKMWTYEDIQTKKVNLRESMTKAVEEQQNIYVQSLFSLDPNGTTYIRGEKEYWFTFIQLRHARRTPDELLNLTSIPLATLYDGVFMTQSHVEAYMSIFQRAAQAEAFKSQTFSNGSRRESTSPSVTPLNLNRSASVLIDGFKSGQGDQAFDTAGLRNKIIDIWEQRIASLDMTSDLFAIVYNLLLISLAQFDDVTEGFTLGGTGATTEALGERRTLLAEIYLFTQSRAARLYSLMELNRSLRELLYKFDSATDIPAPIITSLLKAYRTGLMQFFGSTRAEGEQTSQEEALYKAISYRLDKLPSSSADVNTSALTMKTLCLLKDISSYIYTVYLSLVNDVLEICPAIRKIVASLKIKYPSDDTKTEAHKFLQTVSESKRALLRDKQFVHGAEDQKIIRTHNNAVINVEGCIQQSGSASRQKAKSAIYAKYMIDSHLDEVWHEFLLDANTRSKGNPYALLITAFRQAAMKIDLLYETDADVHLRIQPTQSVEVVDKITQMCCIDETSFFGLKSALRTVCIDVVEVVFEKLRGLFQTDFTQQSGPYKVAICTALTNDIGLFGTLDPYLSEIEVHEHCFVSGPSGCMREALQLYVKITFENLVMLYKSNEFVIEGISFNDSIITLDNVIRKKKGFASNMEHCIMSKAPVFLKLYVLDEWRFVPVIKRYVFHFISEDLISQPKCRSLSDVNRLRMYQNIFHDLDRAVFYWMRCYPNADPFSKKTVDEAHKEINAQILVLMKRYDWISVYRLLAWSAIIGGDTRLLVEVWRMLHSIARRLDYVIRLGRTVKDLMGHVVAEMKREAEEEEDEKIERQPGPVHMSIDEMESMLGNMAAAMIRKTEDVCSEQCTMASQTVIDAVVAKMTSIIDIDEEDDIFVECSMQNMMKLDEAIEMLTTLYDSAVTDVHSVNVSVQQKLEGLRMKSEPTKPDRALRTGTTLPPVNNRNAIMNRTPKRRLAPVSDFHIDTF